MKIILIKPYLPASQRTIATLPSGLLYLASYLKKQMPEIAVKVMDPDIFQESGSKDSINSFIEDVVSEKPDIVGITVFSHVLPAVNQTAALLKEALPQLCLIIGGYHVNAVGERSLDQIPLADYAIYGEGEKSLVYFCRQFSQAGKVIDPESIAGLIYRSADGFVSVPNTYMGDLDEFDPLDFSLINLQDYFAFGSPMGVFRRGNHVAQMITTRGCPFLCTFCAASLNMGKKVRRRSVKNIIQEIETLLLLGADEIHIMDDNFTLHREHVINLCQEIVNRGIKTQFCMPNGVRLDLLDEEMLVWMKRAGWYHLGFGVEVGSDEALKNIKKNLSMAKISEKIRLIKKVGGMTVTGFFILGLPHDTRESMKETAATPDRLGLDMASFGNFTPLPGTENYRELEARGEISADYLPSFANGIVTYAPKGISFAELARIQRSVVLQYWLHPKRIVLVLTRLKPRDLIYALRRMYHIVFRPEVV